MKIATNGEQLASVPRSALQEAVAQVVPASLHGRTPVTVSGTRGMVSFSGGNEEWAAVTPFVVATPRGHDWTAVLDAAKFAAAVGQLAAEQVWIVDPEPSDDGPERLAFVAGGEAATPLVCDEPAGTQAALAADGGGPWVGVARRELLDALDRVAAQPATLAPCGRRLVELVVCNGFLALAAVRGDGAPSSDIEFASARVGEDDRGVERRYLLEQLVGAVRACRARIMALHLGTAGCVTAILDIGADPRDDMAAKQLVASLAQDERSAR
jgi:hypothetical protein